MPTTVYPFGGWINPGEPEAGTQVFPFGEWFEAAAAGGTATPWYHNLQMAG